MKTSEQLKADLAVLQAALTETLALSEERATRSYRVQSTTAQVVLGNATKQELADAQAALQESVEALPRVASLRASISEMEASIAFTIGRERAEFCQSVSGDFNALYQTYVEQGKALLATFRQLQALSNQHNALTGRPLLDYYHRELNLPQVTGMLSARSTIPTGGE